MDSIQMEVLLNTACKIKQQQHTINASKARKQNSQRNTGNLSRKARSVGRITKNI